MTVAAVQDKLPQAVFALFVWQCDLLSEVTAAEAEAFFRFLDSAGTYGLSKEACEELQRSYSKQWRDYLRSGAMRPEQLNQFVNQVDGSARQALLGLLQALTDAAPRKKRQLQSSLSNLLNRLVNGHDAALTGLQAIYRESRFYGDEVADAAPAAPAEAVVATETTVKVVEETHVVSAGTTAVAETTTQATVSSNQRVMAVHKMVPWTEHDAVSPERLQFWTKGTRLMRCIGIVDRSHDFRSFQFVSEEPTLFFYKPGQFVTLELTIDGKRYLRSYTISSSPSRPHLIEISVKRVKGGLVSNYLHDHLHIGDSVLMKPPGGKFHCFDTTSDKYLFLAAG
ncbi:MAG TPA: FAD-binding oxidoreductase, partial [Turneriella sp.]|nr:FAD-binding oxidoreductase [Turneriella sp.]